MQEPKEYIIQDEPEYLARVKVENFAGLEVPFLHLDFKDFKLSSLKKLLKAWKLFRETVRGNFYALSNQDDFKKHRKFVTLLGFKYFDLIECPDGKRRPCYISRDIKNG